MAGVNPIHNGRRLVGELSQFGELCLNSLILFAVLPDCGPVDLCPSTRRRSNRFEHVFGRISAYRTLCGAITRKVVKERFGASPNVTKIDRPAAFGK
jgi:hypothetical protein